MKFYLNSVNADILHKFYPIPISQNFCRKNSNSATKPYDNKAKIFNLLCSSNKNQKFILYKNLRISI
jgi:hypothetical protein